MDLDVDIYIHTYVDMNTHIHTDIWLDHTNNLVSCFFNIISYLSSMFYEISGKYNFFIAA